MPTVKILFIGHAHHKILKNMTKGFQLNGWDYKIGNESDIANYEIIYSPATRLPIEKYPNKKFVFGPQFSVFPDNKSVFINNPHNNAIYIQPSPWALSVWKDEFKYSSLPITYYPIGVDTEDFKPTSNISERSEVIIYHKRRDDKELAMITTYLDIQSIKYQVVTYGKYEENNFKQFLSHTKYAIWLASTESQGLALLETLSMDVPILVWSAQHMSQELGCPSVYFKVQSPGTTIPYWNQCCGEVFYNQSDFISTYEKFINNLSNYSPRQFVVSTLELQQQTVRFLDVVNQIPCSFPRS